VSGDCGEFRGVCGYGCGAEKAGEAGLYIGGTGSRARPKTWRQSAGFGRCGHLPRYIGGATVNQCSSERTLARGLVVHYLWYLRGNQQSWSNAGPAYLSIGCVELGKAKREIQGKRIQR
jgi:hypothetical protein